MRYNTKMMITLNIDDTPYIPNETNDFERKKKDDKIPDLKFDYLYEEADISCVQKFLMFIGQDYFKPHVFLAHNARFVNDQSLPLLFSLDSELTLYYFLRKFDAQFILRGYFGLGITPKVLCVGHALYVIQWKSTRILGELQKSLIASFA